MGHSKVMIINKLLAFFVVCFTSVVVFLAEAAADEVIRHPVRPTNNQFVESKDITIDQLMIMLNAKTEFEDFKKNPLKYSKEQTPAYLLKNLDSCAFSQVRKATVAETPQARIANFNYVFYSVDVAADVKRAKDYGRQAIGYKAGKHRLDNPLIDARAGWAKLAQVKCLPTHVYLENSDRGSYMVYAEGEKAWEAKGQ